MILFQITIHFIFYFLISLIPIGYGQLINGLLLKNTISEEDLGFLGILGFLTLYLLSILIHFFIPLNNVAIILTLLCGLFLFSYFFYNKYFHINKFILLIFILILFYPLTIILYPNEDFFLYYLPYLNYLISSKTIIGLVNINDILAFSTNSLYDIYVFFRIPIFIEHGYSIPSISFYVFFLYFFFNIINKTKNIYFIIIVILSIITFNKLRNFGTAIPPQLLLIASTCLIYDIYRTGIDNQKLTKLLTLLTFAVILRFNSIIILPIVILFIILNFKKIINYCFSHKFYSSFLLFCIIIFFLKNILTSGCLVYPVHQTCFNSIKWGPNYEVTKLKYQKLQSDSKGWPFYAKENFQINEKFVWDNLQKPGFKSFSDYSISYPWFWSKYWLKDHNYKKIINLLVISTIVSLLIISFNKRSKKINKINKIDYLFLISVILTCLLWYNISPQTRYGGYFVFIILFSFVGYLIITKFFEIANLFTVILLIVLSIAYVETKNIKRIYTEYNEKKFSFFPWPYYPELKINKDYILERNKTHKYYKRIKSDKLIFDNQKNYILMCGNVPFPCIPIGKEVCLGNRSKFVGYSIFSKNKNSSGCYDFMNKNILY